MCVRACAYLPVCTRTRGATAPARPTCLFCLVSFAVRRRLRRRAACYVYSAIDEGCRRVTLWGALRGWISKQKTRTNTSSLGCCANNDADDAAAVDTATIKFDVVFACSTPHRNTHTHTHTHSTQQHGPINLGAVVIKHIIVTQIRPRSQSQTLRLGCSAQHEAAIQRIVSLKTVRVCVWVCVCARR